VTDGSKVNSDASQQRKLRELAWLFLRLGTTAFGGPAAHIAMMEDEVVRRRAWLSAEEFLDLLGATNLIPGPNSTEMAIHIGHKRAGWAGLLVAGTCFLVPAVILVTIIAWAYVRYGALPHASGILLGVKPVIIAVVIQALWGFTRTAIKSRFLALIGVAAVAAAFLGANELIVLLAGGVAVMAARWLATARPKSPAACLVPLCGSLKAASAVGLPAFGAFPLFLFFLKVGAVLFGSGYVLLAFLRADLVEHWHWLTDKQLLDAIAVGQFTTGPVFTTATFIGYILGGTKSALFATLGIFLPAFVFVAISGPIVPRLRRSVLAGAFLDGVNVASLSLMVAVTWFLGRAAITNIWTLLLFAGSAVALFCFRVNSAWLVLAGALAGFVAVRFAH
jgi:chromate transporter